MRKKAMLVTVALSVVAAGSVATRASDRVAVYGKVDRVVLEPNADAPTAIQVWGVFSIAQARDRNDYQPAARGYLYYALPAKADLARREWADLKGVAGTGTIVAFGSRWEGVPQLRQPNDPPAKPDPYSTNAGLTKVQGRVEYGPIRALLDFNR
jgi:hypothetical protein